MPTPIDFYFDFSSPYGYFAAEKIDALGAKYGRAVNWHPILLGAVFKINGQQPLTLANLTSTVTGTNSNISSMMAAQHKLSECMCRTTRVAANSWPSSAAIFACSCPCCRPRC